MKHLTLLAIGLLAVGCGGSGGGTKEIPFAFGAYTGSATGGNGDAYGSCSVVLVSGSASLTFTSKTETLAATGALVQGKYAKGSYSGPGGEAGDCQFKIMQVNPQTVEGSIVFERPGYQTYLKFEASR